MVVLVSSLAGFVYPFILLATIVVNALPPPIDQSTGANEDDWLVSMPLEDSEQFQQVFVRLGVFLPDEGGNAIDESGIERSPSNLVGVEEYGFSPKGADPIIIDRVVSEEELNRNRDPDRSRVEVTDTSDSEEAARGMYSDEADVRGKYEIIDWLLDILQEPNISQNREPPSPGPEGDTNVQRNQDLGSGPRLDDTQSGAPFVDPGRDPTISPESILGSNRVDEQTPNIPGNNPAVDPESIPENYPASERGSTDNDDVTDVNDNQSIEFDSSETETVTERPRRGPWQRLKRLGRQTYAMLAEEPYDEYEDDTPETVSQPDPEFIPDPVQEDTSGGELIAEEPKSSFLGRMWAALGEEEEEEYSPPQGAYPVQEPAYRADPMSNMKTVNVMQVASRDPDGPVDVFTDKAVGQASFTVPFTRCRVPDEVEAETYSVVLLGYVQFEEPVNTWRPTIWDGPDGSTVYCFHTLVPIEEIPEIYHTGVVTREAVENEQTSVFFTKGSWGQSVLGDQKATGFACTAFL